LSGTGGRSRPIARKRRNASCSAPTVTGRWSSACARRRPRAGATRR